MAFGNYCPVCKGIVDNNELCAQPRAINLTGGNPV